MTVCLSLYLSLCGPASLRQAFVFLISTPHTTTKAVLLSVLCLLLREVPEYLSSLLLPPNSSAPDYRYWSSQQEEVYERKLPSQTEQESNSQVDTEVEPLKGESV